MPFNDRELLARLIRCEAGGEGIDGMRAVASVVMNRVHIPYGEYMRTGQGSLRRVVTAPREFTCLMPTVYGQTNPQTIWSNPPEDIHYEVADWALSGGKFQGSGDSLWYYNPFRPACGIYFPATRTGVIYNRVGEHCFYTPTSLYART